MREKNKKTKSSKAPVNIIRVVLILFCILNISSVYIFIWHVEISMDFKEGTILEDGYRVVDPIKAYHNHMYALLFFTIATMLILLLNINKIAGSNMK